jgi:hypothetical protein
MQAQAAYAIGLAMIRSLPIAALLAAAASITSAQGPIGTADRGLYVCEMPGDAGGRAAIPQPERNFTIETASRYASPQGGGTYLRHGTRVEMTSGPRKGDTYVIVRPGFLRPLEADGKAGRMRCVLQGSPG